jgi:putative lipase involved disintegration of autophagic bodies
MSKIYADNLGSRGGQSIVVDNSVNVSGILTATTISATTYENIPASSDWRDASLF